MIRIAVTTITLLLAAELLAWAHLLQRDLPSKVLMSDKEGVKTWTNLFC